MVRCIQLGAPSDDRLAGHPRSAPMGAALARLATPSRGEYILKTHDHGHRLVGNGIVAAWRLVAAIHAWPAQRLTVPGGRESVYLETTVISYLTSKPSRDLMVAAHQQATHDWWQVRRRAFACYVSQVVLDEAGAGDATVAAGRMALISEFAALAATGAADRLAEAFVRAGAMPVQSIRDAAHVAIAAANGIDYLLTWNGKHLANAQIMRRVALICNAHGLSMPVVCTPEELMGE